jgi:hypothetical protein
MLQLVRYIYFLHILNAGWACTIDVTNYINEHISYKTHANPKRIVEIIFGKVQHERPFTIY